MGRRSRLLVTFALVTGVAACVSTELDETELAESEATDATARHGNQRRVKLAWLDSDPANTYDAANLAGVQAAADAEGRTWVTPFYSFFDPALQLEQCLDVVAANRHDTIVIIPVDAVGIIPCVRAARHRGIPVVAADLPIGPDISTVEPQVWGQAGAVLVPPAEWGDALVPLVQDLCAGQAPCRVLYIAGSFDVANDQVAVQRLSETAGIELIADQAFYDRGFAAAIAGDVLAQQPAIHVIIGAGDQMAQGAEDAIAAAGLAPGAIRIVGAGAGAYGVDAVRTGRWYATFMALPYDEGKLAARIAIRAARWQWIWDRGIHPVERRGWPAFFTVDNQHLFVGFTPQWPG